MRRAVALVCLLALGLPTGARAFHQRTPAFLQVTPAAPGTVGNPRWAGFRYVLFDSDADLLGNGNTGRQVFMFDLQARDITGTLSIDQLTFGDGDAQRASTGKRAKRVAYDALPGGVGPRQVYLLERKTNARYQLTHGGTDSLNAVMDDGDRVIVFESTADFFGSGLTGPQIYRIDLRKTVLGCPFPCPATGNAGLSRVTHVSGNNVNAATSVSGKVVVYQSDGDPLGSGDTEPQIYLYDVRKGTTTAVSHGPGASRHPSMSMNGSLVAFESDADLAGLSSTGTQIYLYERKKNALVQITNAPAGNSTRPSVSASRQAITFVSTDDLLSSGSAGPEIFDYDLRAKALRQLTVTASTPHEPAYSAGVFTTFLSDGDLLGNGSAGIQLYLVNLYALAGGTVPLVP